MQTGLPHPGAAEVIAHDESDWRQVVAGLTGLVPGNKTVWFQNHMSHHLLPNIELEWLLQTFNEKNRDLLVNIDGRLVHRDQAGISPFDSAGQGGDAVWEGLRLCREQGQPHTVRDLSLAEFYRADEMLCTGTMGELAPVIQLDGRPIGSGKPGPITQQLTHHFTELTAREGVTVV